MRRKRALAWGRKIYGRKEVSCFVAWKSIGRENQGTSPTVRTRDASLIEVELRLVVANVLGLVIALI